MKKVTFFILFCLLNFYLASAQDSGAEPEFEPSGNAFGKVFWNYNYNIADETGGFEVKRTYLGYKYKFSEKLSAKITLDGGKESNASSYTVFVKNALLDWQVHDMIKLSGGLIGLKQFNDQEKFRGYRYVFKMMQDEFKFGTSADLGFNAEFKPHDMIKLDVFVINGEGYTNLQDPYGKYLIGGDVVFTPVKGLTLKGYFSANDVKKEYDITDSTTMVIDSSMVKNLAFFAGYKTENFRIGGEFNLMLDGTKYTEAAEDHNLMGIAIYGAYTFGKFEAFGNYAYLTSNKVNGSDVAWNNSKDGNQILASLQYAPVKGVKMALNYRSFIYTDSDVDTDSSIFMNFEFSF